MRLIPFGERDGVDQHAGPAALARQEKAVCVLPAGWVVARPFEPLGIQLFHEGSGLAMPNLVPPQMMQATWSGGEGAPQR